MRTCEMETEFLTTDQTLQFVEAREQGGLFILESSVFSVSKKRTYRT